MTTEATTPEPTPAPTPEVAPSPAPKTGLASRLQDLMRDKEPAPPKPKDEDPALPNGDEPAPEPGKKPAAQELEKKSEAASPEQDQAVEAEIKKTTAGMTAAQKAAFTNLRYAERALRRELEKVKAEAGAATKPAEGTQPPEVEDLRRQLQEAQEKLTIYKGEVAVSRIEATDEFKAQVVAPRTKIGEQAEKFVSKYKLNEDAVIQAFQSGDSDAVATVVADMSEFDRHSFYQLVSRYQDIDTVERNLRANAETELERINRQTRERQEQEGVARKSEWAKAVPEVWDKLQDEFPVLAPIEGDAEWNKEIEAVKDFASDNRFQNLTTREQVEVLFRARAFPAVLAELDNIRSEYDRVNTELKKYEKVVPDAGAGGRPPASAPDESGMSLGEKLRRRLGK